MRGEDGELTCADAIRVALAALPPDHPTITQVDFHPGGYCPPNARCAYVDPTRSGFVVFWITNPTDRLWVSVRALDDGRVVALGAVTSFPARTAAG